MEIQTRQWPVATANPITDSYSGLTACVSINVAVALRVGDHRIAYQPSGERGLLAFFVDVERSHLPKEGLEPGPHRLTIHATDPGELAPRVVYAHATVVTVTPRFWHSQTIWYTTIPESEKRHEQRRGCQEPQ